MEQGAVSPGGPRVSSAKKRRLQALEQNLSRAAGAGEPARSALPRADSSSVLRPGGGGSKRRSGGGAGEQPQRQQQAAEPVYSRLDEGIAAGPAAEALGLPRAEPGSAVVSDLLEQLMATNPRAFDARAAIGLKVADRTVMLDNPVGQKGAAGGPRGGYGTKWAAQLAGRKAQRERGLYGLQAQAEGLTYAAVLPLHRSWQQYMQQLLAGANAAAAGANDLLARLYAADLHGCLIRVAHTNDARYCGLQGIVVRDTANTLQLVTPDNRFVGVPKRLCTWEFDADRRRVVTLLGAGLAQRGADAGGASGTRRPATLRDAIRGQQHQQPR